MSDITDLKIKTQDTENQVLARVSVPGPHGAEQFNPVMAAALIERASIDGDVPELRTGPLPDGGRPAVPVQTDAVDPVSVGLMLDRAATIVATRIQLAVETWRGEVLQIINQATASGTDLAEIRDQFPVYPVNVEGYVAGEFPAPMVLSEVPTGEELVSLNLDQRRKYTYLSIATTQGRRSLAPSIQRTLSERLGVPEGRVRQVQGSARWAMEIHGPEDMDERFSFVETAIASMIKDLRPQVRAQHPKFVEVIPAADIPARIFGWIARIGGNPE